MRLVIRIGSGLLVATVIAIALTVPAPAFNARYQDHGGALTISAARRQAGSGPHDVCWPMAGQVSDHSDRWSTLIGAHCEL